MAAIAGLALKAIIEECLDGWRRYRPFEYQAFKGMMRIAREIHGEHEGVGEFGLMKGEIPDTLYNAIGFRICCEMGSWEYWNWRHIPEIRNAFWRLFEMGTINKNSFSNR